MPAKIATMPSVVIPEVSSPVAGSLVEKGTPHGTSVVPGINVTPGISVALGGSVKPGTCVTPPIGVDVAVGVEACVGAAVEVDVKGG